MIAKKTLKLKKWIGLSFLNSNTPTLVKNLAIGNERR